MSKKQFKTESKRLLDLMINSVYTNKEIFLRELISNASDALDKLYFKTLTDNSDIKRGDLEIRIAADKTARTLTISDNGIGMTKEELESNLGTIAKSGTLAFKNDNELDKDDMDVIGQFGVGFYSAFMVSKKITVLSRAYGSDEAWQWESEGLDGYTVEPAQKDSYGTVITLYLKDNTDDERYDSYLETYTIRELVRKYSDYIRYPIRMLVETQREKTHECTCDHDAEGKCTCDHDHDDECCCGHDHDHEHHHHDDACGCGHEHHHHHHADEVFTSWGQETVKTFTKEQIEGILKKLSEDTAYGMVLRAKGMVAGADGQWIYFDMVPEEYEVRDGAPEFTGRICVIGSKLAEDKLAELFGL